MSRTQEVTRTETPVVANIFFNGELGKFSCLYGEDAELTELPFPLRFIVVDDGAHRVTGKKGLDKDSPKWKSTLAHEHYGTSMKVWLDNAPDKIEGNGTWAGMKGNLYPLGARYTKLIFVITDMGKGKVLACLQLKGRAFSAWIDATRDINPCGDISFVVKGTKEMKGDKGKPSLVPVFETAKLTEETKKIAEAADVVLQGWLKAQFEPSDIPATTQSRTNGNGEPQPRETTRQSNAHPTAVPDDFPTEEPAFVLEENDDDTLPF